MYMVVVETRDDGFSLQINHPDVIRGFTLIGRIVNNQDFIVFYQETCTYIVLIIQSDYCPVVIKCRTHRLPTYQPFVTDASI